MRLLRYDIPYNFAKINNWAARRAEGFFLVLLNNDTEILTADWLEAMVEQAQRPSIGAVGAMLLYDDDTIQHAGVIVGINGVAGHSHKHFPRDSGGYFQMLKAVTTTRRSRQRASWCERKLPTFRRAQEELTVAFNDVISASMVPRSYQCVAAARRVSSRRVEEPRARHDVRKAADPLSRGGVHEEAMGHGRSTGSLLQPESH